MKTGVLSRIILLLCVMLMANAAQAACSSWRSPQQKVWFNEYFFGSGSNAPPNFLEIYSTSNVFATQWQGSTVEVYSAANTKTTYTFNNSTATACTVGSKSWITYNVLGGLRQQNALVILRDPLGDTIDAFVFDNGPPPAPWVNATNNWAPSNTTGCAALDSALTTQAAQSGTVPKQNNMLVLSNYGNKDMARDPDGGSKWDLTSNTGAGTTYTQCVSNNANLTKTVDNSTPTPGTTVTFTISIANTGNSALTGVVLDDFLPNYTYSGSKAPTFVSAIPVNALDGVSTSTYATTDPNTSTAANATKVTWSLASIAAGTTAKLNIKMQVPSDAVENYVYINTAQTTAGLSVNQTDYASITIGSLNVGSFVFTLSSGSSSTCTPALLAPKLTITAMTGPNGTGVVNTSYGGTTSVFLLSSSSNPKFYNSAGTEISVAPLPAGTFVNGVATVYVTDATPETITVTALDSVTYSPNVMQGTSAPITFTGNNTGLTLTDEDTLSPLYAPEYGVVSGRPHKLRATVTQCGVTATTRTGSYTGTVKYIAGLNHPAGASAPTLSTTASCPGAIGPLTTTGSAMTFTFASGIQDLYLCTTDVGNFAVNMVANLTSPNATPTGTSGEFVVRPFAITATGLVETTAPALPAGKIRAGKDFTATFNAWNWHAAYDADNNGVPDAGVTAQSFLAANSGKPARFSSITNNAGVINFSAGFLSPATGVLGALTPAVAVANAATVTLTNLSYTDVGNIVLTGQAGYTGSGAINYLGMTGLHVPLLSESTRFIPAYLETAVTSGCSGFTYSRQPFQSVVVTAKNNAGGVTANYAASPGVAQVVALSAVGASGSITGGDVVGQPTQFQASHFTSGVATLTTPTFSFSTTPSAPASVTLRALDADSVSSAGHETATAVRSGRARLSNAYGSELLALSMPLKTEYWNGSAWLQNTMDSCVTVGTSGTPNLLLSISDPKAGDTLTPANTTPSFSTPLKSGDAKLRLSAPAQRGPLNVTATVPVWLQYDWDGDGAHDDSPSARATFGVNRNDYIYLRENY